MMGRGERMSYTFGYTDFGIGDWLLGLVPSKYGYKIPGMLELAGGNGT
jgi:hypothetical protein